VIAGGTLVVVIAWGIVGLVQTGAILPAGVIRTRVVVVAVGRWPWGTSPIHALIVESAGIPVAARSGNDRVLAAATDRAGILRTGIAIVAVHQGIGQASPIRAMVTFGAGIVVVAFALVSGATTTRFTVAGVVGAGVSVIAVGLRSAHAFAREAAIVDRACIAIVARDSIGRGCESTVPAHRVARGGQARCVDTLRDRAGYQGTRVDHAQVR